MNFLSFNKIEKCSILGMDCTQGWNDNSIVRQNGRHGCQKWENKLFLVDFKSKDLSPRMLLKI